MFEKADGNNVSGTCANCVAKQLAPKDAAAQEAKIASLKKRGIITLRCLCSEDNVFCLEADHVDGQKFSDTVYSLCLNCHRKRTGRQLSEHPGFVGDPNNPFVRLANKAGAQADFHEFSAAHLSAIAAMM